MTKEKTATRRFTKDDPIETATAGKSILTLAEQMGTVEMELSRPITGEGPDAAVDVLSVEAPDTPTMILFESQQADATPEERVSNELKFYGSCCINISSESLRTIHPKDWRRLQRLLTNFVS